MGWIRLLKNPRLRSCTWTQYNACMETSDSTFLFAPGFGNRPCNARRHRKLRNARHSSFCRTRSRLRWPLNARMHETLIFYSSPSIRTTTLLQTLHITMALANQGNSFSCGVLNKVSPQVRNTTSPLPGSRCHYENPFPPIRNTTSACCVRANIPFSPFHLS